MQLYCWVEIILAYHQNIRIYILGGLLQNLILIQAWSIPIYESWNVPAWSISCEWIAYIFFPVLIILSKAVTRSVLLFIVTGASALLIMALLLQNMHDDGANRYGIIRIAGEFVTGVCLCNLFHARAGLNWNWNIIISISLVVSILFLGFLLPLCSLVAYWCVPFLAIMILGLAYRRCVYSRLLSTKLFLFGGHISYSLYMVHSISYIVLNHLFPKLEARPMSFMVDLTFCVVAATVMFYFVEDPCRKKMRKLYPRRKQQP